MKPQAMPRKSTKEMSGLPEKKLKQRRHHGHRQHHVGVAQHAVLAGGQRTGGLHALELRLHQGLPKDD
jgi:hypothetical protein